MRSLTEQQNTYEEDKLACCQPFQEARRPLNAVDFYFTKTRVANRVAKSLSSLKARGVVWSRWSSASGVWNTSQPRPLGGFPVLDLAINYHQC